MDSSESCFALVVSFEAVSALASPFVFSWAPCLVTSPVALSARALSAAVVSALALCSRPHEASARAVTAIREYLSSTASTRSFWRTNISVHTLGQPTCHKIKTLESASRFERRSSDHDRDVVAAAPFERERDQVVDDLFCGRCTREMVLDLVVRDVLREPVRAEHDSS